MPTTHAAMPLWGLPVGTKIMFGGRQFAVLKPAEGLVVSQKSTTSMGFDANNTNTYDPSDSNNIGYYLNNTYYNSFPATEKALIKNSTWYTGNETNETASSVNTYIGLLRESEYNTAQAAGIFPSSGEYALWWLITRKSLSTTNVRYVTDAGNVSQTSAGGTSCGVRPAFRILESTIFEYDTKSGMYYYPSTAGIDKTIGELNIGNTIMFHGEAWRVVNPSEGLLVMDRIKEKRAFDPDGTQTYNPSDSNNIAWYLNNTYFNNFTAAEKLLIKNSTWYIGNETNEMASSVDRYIGLLRQSEYNTARDSGIFPSAGENLFMWLITPYSGDTAKVWYGNGNTSPQGSNYAYGIRPAFRMLETEVLESIGNGVYKIYQDTTSPTVDITYSLPSPYKTGTAVIITSTFDEPIADSPIPQISISGANTLANTNMTKTSATVYTYTHTVGAGDGTATVALATAQDLAGNTVTSAPTSGATFTVDNTPPAVPTFTPSTTDWTNQDITVVINYPAGSLEPEYQIDLTGFQAYTGVLTIPANCSIHAKCKDEANNVSTTATLSVINIDKTPPNAPTVSPGTGTYNAAQEVTVSNTSGDVAHTYYTTDGTNPDNTDTEAIGGTLNIDGLDGQTKTLKLVSYDGINKGAISIPYLYTFNKTGPIITANPTGRTKSPDNINVNITITSDNLNNWQYQWDTDSTLDEGNWTTGDTNPQALDPKTEDGTWYLHVRAEDDDENIITQTYGTYKKGTVSPIEGYAADSYPDERKYFKYYVGLDANNIGRVMLVAPKDAGGVKPIFTRDDILDQATHRFKVNGVYYIDREGKIQEYD